MYRSYFYLKKSDTFRYNTMDFKQFCENHENEFCFDAVDDDMFPWKGSSKDMLTYLHSHDVSELCLDDFITIRHAFEKYRTSNFMDSIVKRYDELLALFTSNDLLLSFILDELDKNKNVYKWEKLAFKLLMP